MGQRERVRNARRSTNDRSGDAANESGQRFKEALDRILVSNATQWIERKVGWYANILMETRTFTTETQGTWVLLGRVELGVGESRNLDTGTRLGGRVDYDARSYGEVSPLGGRGARGRPLLVVAARRSLRVLQMRKGWSWELTGGWRRGVADGHRIGAPRIRWLSGSRPRSFRWERVVEPTNGWKVRTSSVDRCSLGLVELLHSFAGLYGVRRDRLTARRRELPR